MIATAKCEMCGEDFSWELKPGYTRHFCPSCAHKRKIEYKRTRRGNGELSRLVAENKRIESERITRDIERRRLNRSAAPDTAPRFVRYDQDGTRVEIRGNVGGIQIWRA